MADNEEEVALVVIRYWLVRLLTVYGPPGLWIAALHHRLFGSNGAIWGIDFALFAMFAVLWWVVAECAILPRLVVRSMQHNGTFDGGSDDEGSSLTGAPVPRKPLPSHLSGSEAIDILERDL
jgi:hypothetical protein